MADFDSSWANAEKEYTVLFVLYAKFGHDDVQRGFRCAVQRICLNPSKVYEVQVAMAARHGDNLLDVAPHNQGKEEAHEMNVACNIDLVQVCRNLVNLLGLLAADEDRVVSDDSSLGQRFHVGNNIQSADRVIGVKLRRKTRVDNQVVNTSVTQKLVGIGGCLL